MSHRVLLRTTGGPEVLEYAPASLPSPGPGELVVRNRATAVNFIDTVIRRGQMPPGAMPDLPHVLGVEGSGVVESVGTNVSEFVSGDRVVWMGPLGAGGYGTYSLLRPGWVARLPDGVSTDSAAALPVAAVTAWQLLVRIAAITAGQTVLVRGAAGGVGTILVQMAKHLGGRVIAVTSSAKLDFVREHGADHVLSYEDSAVADEVLRLTEGRGVDVACNPVSGPTVLEDLTSLAPFGRILIFGFLAGEPQGSFSPDLVRQMRRSVGVQVSDVYTLFNADPKAFGAALHDAVELYAKGILRPPVHARFDLAHAAKAHALLERSAARGKILIDIP